jgi:hypothetical protein
VAKILGLFPSALVAAAAGETASEWIKTMQSIGLGARTSEMRQLYTLAAGIVRRSPDEIFRDIGQVPTGPEIQVWPTKKATGIVQTVTLVYRDRTTGKLNQTYWKTSNPVPMTREAAMATAVSAYADQAERYNQDLVGAVHTSTYQQVPFPTAA